MIENRGFYIWGGSSAWLERLPVTQEVASSSLVHPATNSLPAQREAFLLRGRRDSNSRPPA